jgi:hypothetical protein
VDLGKFYIDRVSAGHQELNYYGGDIDDGTSLPFIGATEWQRTRSRTRCGSLVSLLLGQAYPYLDDNGLYTDGIHVIEALTGSISPRAAQWHDAIADERGAGKYLFRRVLRVADIRRGDILAAKYSLNSTDGTGHVAIVDSIRPRAFTDPLGESLPGTSQWIVRVVDSSRNTHSHDTRTNTDTNGIGSGELRLYESDSTGELAGWSWSTAAGSDAYTSSQPMVVGRLLVSLALTTGIP